MDVSNNKLILVFITGLGHSGSTLLDMLLSSQKSITGLGEVDKILSEKSRDRFLNKFHKYPCTCGKEPSDCEIWGNFKTFADQSERFTFVEGYRKIKEIVAENSNAKVIVDSSKSFQTLEKMYNHLSDLGCEKKNFYVLHLSKDVRSFIESKTRGSNSFKNALYQIYHWIKVNRKIENYLSENNIQSLNVGYEEVALSTEYTIAKILQFIGLDSKHVNTRLSETNGHVLFGNNMRINQPDDIYYDYRWFTYRKFQKLTYFFMPILNRYNKRWVYSNTEQIMYKKNKTNSFVAAKKEHLDS